MERNLQDIFPIWPGERDCILSKQGDYTIGFEVSKPEIFSLSANEFEALHQAFIRALKVLPQDSIFHMQDYFRTANYQADFQQAGDSFLSRASERFFYERPYLDHSCYIYLTKKPKGRKQATSASSSLFRRSIIPGEVLNDHAVQEFLDCCGQFKRILEDSGLIRLRRLSHGDIWSTAGSAGLVEQYYNLSVKKEKEAFDIGIKNGLQVGDKYCQLFSLGDAEDLPAMCGPRINYDKYSTDKTKFSVGFAAVLGQLLPVDHIYNQYVFIEDGQASLKKLEAKRLRLQSLSAYSRENAISHDATNAFLNEAVGDQRQPVKAHFNVLAWTDDKEKLKEIRNAVSSSLAQMEATPRQETAGAAQIWYAGIPGNAGDFPINDTFDTFLEQATCFFNVETNYRDSLSPFGLRLVDRLSGHPVHVDLSDEPMTKGLVSNRNKAVFGGSGSGKSMFMNHLHRSYYEQGAHIVIVDVGGSYKGLCDLLDGYYFTYEEKKPIAFNPFYIHDGEVENACKLTPLPQRHIVPVGHFKLTPLYRLKLTPL